MKDLLISRGVALRLGPASFADAQAEVAMLGRWIDADPA